MDISNNQFLCNDILIVGYEVDEAGNPPSFSSWVVHIAKSILKKVFAYAIMPIGKKDAKVPCEQRTNPRTVLHHSSGILLFFYSGKAPTRLFVAPVVSV